MPSCFVVGEHVQTAIPQPVRQGRGAGVADAVRGICPSRKRGAVSRHGPCGGKVVHESNACLGGQTGLQFGQVAAGLLDGLPPSIRRVRATADPAAQAGHAVQNVRDRRTGMSRAVNLPVCALDRIRDVAAKPDDDDAMARLRHPELFRAHHEIGWLLPFRQTSGALGGKGEEFVTLRPGRCLQIGRDEVEHPDAVDRGRKHALHVLHDEGSGF